MLRFMLTTSFLKEDTVNILKDDWSLFGHLRSSAVDYKGWSNLSVTYLAQKSLWKKHILLSKVLEPWTIHNFKNICKY